MYRFSNPYAMVVRVVNLRLTSLLLVEERLLEAKYFARRLTKQCEMDRFGYELNAFLAAARSVTFLLQKEMARVPGFAEWWDGQRQLLSSDPAAVFFLKLRNFSQKEGRISLVGGRVGHGRGHTDSRATHTKSHQPCLTATLLTVVTSIWQNLQKSF